MTYAATMAVRRYAHLAVDCQDLGYSRVLGYDSRPRIVMRPKHERGQSLRSLIVESLDSCDAPIIYRWLCGAGTARLYVYMQNETY